MTAKNNVISVGTGNRAYVYKIASNVYKTVVTRLFCNNATVPTCCVRCEKTYEVTTSLTLPRLNIRSNRTGSKLNLPRNMNDEELTHVNKLVSTKSRTR